MLLMGYLMGLLNYFAAVKIKVVTPNRQLVSGYQCCTWREKTEFNPI